MIDRHWKADFIVEDDPLKGAKDRKGGSWGKYVPTGYRYGLIAVGDNRTRKAIVDRIEPDEPMYGMLVLHDAAQGWCGIGTVCLDGAIIQVDTYVGDHCIINTCASVDHDCRIKDFVHIAPGAHLCGNVTVGEGTLVGAGTIVTPGVTIGPWLVIPAGSVVTKDCLNEEDVAQLRRR